MLRQRALRRNARDDVKLSAAASLHELERSSNAFAEMRFAPRQSGEPHLARLLDRPAVS